MGGTWEAFLRGAQWIFGGVPEYHPAHDRVNMALVERIVPVAQLLGRYFRASYHGLENVPTQGPALLVGNHGLAVYDVAFLGAAIYRARGRLIRGLGEHLLFDVPGSRHLFSAIGAVPGTRENAVAFLRAGHLMIAYPGGARDALKGPHRLYQLHWARSLGFVRVALRAQVPLLLLSTVGPDEVYRIIGRIRWTGRVLGGRKYEAPILWGWGPIPRPVKFTTTISEPIWLPGRPEDADDPATVQRLHADIWQRAQAQLDACLKARRSLWRA